MDKMGSSSLAGNWGIPATSWNGAPVELTALLYACLWMMKLFYEEGYLKIQGVFVNKDKLVTFGEWKKLIKWNFENYYWIPKFSELTSQHKIEW